MWVAVDCKSTDTEVVIAPSPTCLTAWSVDVDDNMIDSRITADPPACTLDSDESARGGGTGSEFVMRVALEADGDFGECAVNNNDDVISTACTLLWDFDGLGTDTSHGYARYGPSPLKSHCTFTLNSLSSTGSMLSIHPRYEHNLCSI